MNIQAIQEKIDAIEKEMKHIGLWRSEPLPESAYDIKEAFGADTMSLAQWIEFILIPRVQEMIRTNGPWPETSEVGTYAAQQYLFFRPVGDPQTLVSQGSTDQKEIHLVTLLQEFDSLFAKQNS